MTGAVCALGLWLRVEGGAEIIAAATAFHYLQSGDLNSQFRFLGFKKFLKLLGKVPAVFPLTAWDLPYRNCLKLLNGPLRPSQTA